MGALGWNDEPRDRHGHDAESTSRRRSSTPRRRSRLLRARWLVVAVAAALCFGRFAGVGVAYLTVGTTSPSSGAAVAGSVDKVTGLELGAGAVTPTADPNVPLTWDTGTLTNGVVVNGYLVNRYDSHGDPQTTGAGCAIDSVTATSCTESDVPDGTWKYGVQATQYNWFGPQSDQITVVVDTSAPTITAEPASFSADSSPSFGFTDSTYSSYECNLDGAGFSSCSSPDAVGSLGDGPHTFQVEALDANGVATKVASYDWAIDTSAPTFTSKPSDPSADSTPTFKFSHSEASYTFECQLDGGSFTTCASPDTLTSLGDGSHTLTVEALDADGFADPNTISTTWTVDTTAPTVTAEPSSFSAATAPSFSFDHAEGSYTFECQLDGGGYSACTSPESYSGLADGPHTFKVEGIDADGVATAAASYDWTIDTSAPTFTSAPSSPSANPAPTFAFSHNHYTSFVCQLDSSGTYTAAQCSPSGLGNASHTLLVKAEATDSSLTTAASYTWTVDATAPTITSEPDNPSANASPSFGFTHAEASYTFECKLDTGSFTTCTSPDALASLSDGSHTFTVEAVDHDGFVDADTASYTWTVNTAAPTISAEPSDPSANAAPAFSFNDGGVYTSFKCQIDGGGFSACASPTSYSALSNASHAFQVEAIDADGIATNPASYTWTVDNSAPSITAEPQNPSTSTSASFSFSHTESTYTFKCQIDGGDFSACTSPRTYSSLASGTSHTFQVEGVDANGVTTQTAAYTWSITTATKLVFTSAAQTLVTGTTSGTITVQRQNASGTPITADPAIIVSLSTTSSGGVFRDTGDTTDIATLTIPQGSSSASFKYKDSSINQPTITAAAGALTSATQVETVNNSAVVGLGIVVNGGSGTPVVSCGTPSTSYTCTITGDGSSGNATFYVTFVNSSGTTLAYSAAASTINETGQNSGSVTIPGNSSSSSPNTLTAAHTGNSTKTSTLKFGSFTLTINVSS